MFDKHNGQLFLALGAVPLTCKDFQLDHFAETWRGGGHAGAETKRRRFASLGADLFTVRGHGGNEEAECQVCHHEGQDVVSTVKDQNDPTPVRKCALCRSLEELGRDLRNASQLVLLEQPPQARSRPGGGSPGRSGPPGPAALPGRELV